MGPSTWLRHLLPGALLAAFIALAAPRVAAADDVWVVDTDWPFADFDDLQPAIDAAADGDTIVVRKQCCDPPFADLFPDVRIEGRSLTLVADGTRPLLLNARIAGTPGGGSVVLRGFKTSALRVEGNAGLVWLEDCELVSQVNVDEVPALRATDNAALVLQGSSVLGLDGMHASLLFPSPESRESPGIVARATHLSLESSLVQGGRGKYSLAPNPIFPEVVGQTTVGKPAVDMSGGSLWLSGCTVRGGAGGFVVDVPPIDPCRFSGADGGDAVWLADARAHVRDSLVVGGEGGVGYPDPCATPPFMASSGLAGAAWVLDRAGVGEVPGGAVHVAVPSPVRELQPLVVELGGEPGLSAWLAVSPLLAPAGGIAHGLGALYVGGAPALVAAGRFDADGHAQLGLALGELPPGVVGMTWTLQGAACDGSTCWTGGASVVVVLGAGI